MRSARSPVPSRCEPATPSRMAARQACCAHARNDTDPDSHVGCGGRVERSGDSRSELVRRAVPDSDEDPRRASPRDCATPRARRRARGDRRRTHRAVLALEGAVRPHARARARAVCEAADLGGRHGAAPPPDRRARGDAHRVDRREPASRRGGGERQRSGNGTAVLEADAELEDEDDEDAGRSTRTRTRSPATSARTPAPSRRYRFRHPTASGKTIAAAGFVEAARKLGVLILTHRRLLVSQFQRDLTTEGYGDRFADAITRGNEPTARTRSRSRPTRGSRGTTTRSRARRTTS